MSNNGEILAVLKYGKVEFTEEYFQKLCKNENTVAAVRKFIIELMELGIFTSFKFESWNQMVKETKLYITTGIRHPSAAIFSLAVDKQSLMNSCDYVCKNIHYKETTPETVSLVTSILLQFLAETID